MTTNVPAGLVDAFALAGGPDVAYAIRTNGSVVTWGVPLLTSLTNVPPNLKDAIAISAGTRHALGLRANGKVVGWGEDQYGKTDAPALLDRVMGVAVGLYSSAGLRRNGAVVAWGDYTFGDSTALPPGLNDAVGIAAANTYGLALRRDGTVAAWGGRINHTNLSDMVKVPDGLSNVVAVAASYYEAFALRDDGTVVHWGSGITPGPIPGLTQVWAMAPFYTSGLLALKEDGTLVQAAIPPVPIPAGISNVVAIGGVGTPFIALSRGPDEPFITQHPQTQTVASGTAATFQVTATAGQLLSYQWQFNGVNLHGATDATLAIPAAWPAQAGHYRVVVAAAGLPITSRAALLKVSP
jgi:alpha-tubulin suppressor-like RCC1 family protein